MAHPQINPLDLTRRSKAPDTSNPALDKLKQIELGQVLQNRGSLAVAGRQGADALRGIGLQQSLPVDQSTGSPLPRALADMASRRAAGDIQRTGAGAQALAGAGVRVDQTAPFDPRGLPNVRAGFPLPQEAANIRLPRTKVKAKRGAKISKRGTEDAGGRQVGGLFDVTREATEGLEAEQQSTQLADIVSQELIEAASRKFGINLSINDFRIVPVFSNKPDGPKQVIVVVTANGKTEEFDVPELGVFD